MEKNLEELKALLGKGALTKSEKKKVSELAKEYGIEFECTTCESRWVTAILGILKKAQENSQEKATEILKPQHQGGVFIGHVFVCEHNAREYLDLIKKFAPNILNDVNE